MNKFQKSYKLDEAELEDLHIQNYNQNRIYNIYTSKEQIEVKKNKFYFCYFIYTKKSESSVIKNWYFY